MRFCSWPTLLVPPRPVVSISALALLSSLTDAHWHMSGEVILMTLLGGVGTILGPLVGATVVVSLQSLLSNGPLGEWVHVILGVIFVLCVLLFRSGIVGWLERLVRRNFK